MKIKTKLTLGVGLLFLLITLLVAVGTSYTNALKSDTENILVANYNTLQYARNMLVALEEANDQSLQHFETNLRQQEKNLTEKGEHGLTRALRAKFELLKSAQSDSSLVGALRKDLFKIIDMNMLAIQKKSERAQRTADKAVFWIAVTGGLCFLISFILLLNLPSNIADPIRELTESIRQIAAKNYAERVHLESHSEFGQLARSFNTMAEKLEEYNNSNLAKLMVEKKRIDALINNMHDPVLGLDEKMNVIFVNEEAVKILGMSQSEMLGHSTAELAASNDLIRILVEDLTATESLPESKTTALKIYADNKEGYFEKERLPISIVPTGEESSKLIGYVIILRNVTEYKELDFAKTNFIATVSHEFKTPISSIKMSVQLLENERIGPLNAEQKNLLESIQDDANRLLKITGELLNMTQVESGNIQLSILPADPKEMLLYAMNATKTQADQKQIRFEVDIPGSLPNVQADAEKTAWVLTNLISNAIRYSYDHSVIQLCISETDQKVDISVKDTGQGIAPQYQDKIFNRYFRVPGTKKEGTGLGLAISKEFIEAQGGRIGVESEFGAGSTFTISLQSLT